MWEKVESENPTLDQERRAGCSHFPDVQDLINQLLSFLDKFAHDAGRSRVDGKDF